jgi:hypothetical protein
MFYINFLLILLKTNKQMEIIVKILRVESLEKISEKFKKRRLIVEDLKNEKYPQTLEFTLVQNNVSLADNLNQGDEVKLFFDLKGKEYLDKNSTKRVFNSLEVWKLEVTKKSLDFVETPSGSSNNEVDDDSSLPF